MRVPILSARTWSEHADCRSRAPRGGCMGCTAAVCSEGSRQPWSRRPFRNPTYSRDLSSHSGIECLQYALADPYAHTATRSALGSASPAERLTCSSHTHTHTLHEHTLDWPIAVLKTAVQEHRSAHDIVCDDADCDGGYQSICAVIACHTLFKYSFGTSPRLTRTSQAAAVMLLVG